MKTKHNKKRNTAFVYEALIRELTRSAVSGNNKRKALLASTLKESFALGGVLAQELECYRSLSETNSLDKDTAARLLKESKLAYEKINKKELFLEQSNLINKINKNFGNYVFSNNVPNYRALATIASVFSSKTSIKSRVIMEGEVLKSLSGEQETQLLDEQVIDDLSLKLFTRSFNEQYSHLLPEQREFLTHYVTSANDNGTAFKAYLNEEVARLRDAINGSLLTEDVRTDPSMLEATKSVLEIIQEFSEREMTENDLNKIMKLQKLVSEYEEDAN
jgi:hypothetical protein